MTTKGGSKDMKAEGRDEGRTRRPQRRNGNMNARDQVARPRRRRGQAGAGAKLSTEQRTKITSVIRDQRRRVAQQRQLQHLGRYPRSARTRASPPASRRKSSTIYPEWRGYEFILVRDQIVVVDPRTLEIVDVLPA